MKQEKFIKRLIGKTKVEGALERLDMLTQEENLMAVARTFEDTHHVNVNVKATQELTQHVDTKVTVIEEVLQQVDGNVAATQELTHHVDDNMMKVQELTCDVHADVKETKGGALIFQFLDTYTDYTLFYVETGMDDLRRSSLPDITIDHCGSNLFTLFTGNQSRTELRRWLASPNPSINHNTAHDTQHDGTANWFIQGPTFDEWKTSGSLLWIRGNRMLQFPCHAFVTTNGLSGFSAGAGKSILWYVIIRLPR